MRARGAVLLLLWGACGFHKDAATGDGGAPGDGGSGSDGSGSGGGSGSDGPPSNGVPATGCGALTAAQGALAVANVDDLRLAVATAAPGTVIVLAPGGYDLAGNSLAITTPGITLRSSTGSAADVTLTSANDSTALKIVASDVTIAAVTIVGGAQGIHVGPTPFAGTTNARIHAVHFVDNHTAVQINVGADAGGGLYADAGTVSCSTIEVTDDAHACATSVGGVSAEGARDWTVRDTSFTNFSCSSGFVRTLRFTHGSRGTHLVGNTFVNGVGNIMLGGDYTSPDPIRTYTDTPACASPAMHQGGIVCNNTISGLDVRGGSQPFQEGIALWNACGDTVAHNSVVAPAGGLTFSTIEYRYPATSVHLVNNLVPTTPKLRDSGTAIEDGDVVYTDPVATFVDPRANLHIAAGAGATDGAALSLVPAECDADRDGTTRDATAPTAGAYER